MELKEFRKKHRISQMKLASMLGVSLLTVQRWENGAGFPNYDNQEKLEEFMQKLEQEGK